MNYKQKVFVIPFWVLDGVLLKDLNQLGAGTVTRQADAKKWLILTVRRGHDHHLRNHRESSPTKPGIEVNGHFYMVAGYLGSRNGSAFRDHFFCGLGVALRRVQERDDSNGNKEKQGFLISCECPLVSLALCQHGIILFQPTVLFITKAQPNPSTSCREAMLQRGLRFEGRLHPATLRHLHDFLRVTARKFAREMRSQIGQHEVDVPAVTLHESHVDLVHEGYAFGSSLFTLFWKVATCSGSQSSWGE